MISEIDSDFEDKKINFAVYWIDTETDDPQMVEIGKQPLPESV